MSDQCYLQQTFRPTVVMLLWRAVCGQIQVLLVRSAKGQNPLQLPQGGINHSELIDERTDISGPGAFFREIQEELSLARAEFSPPRYLGHVISLHTKKISDQIFNNGALYFCLTSQFVGRGNVVLNNENTDFQWVPLYEALELLSREGEKSSSKRSVQFIDQFRRMQAFS